MEIKNLVDCAVCRGPETKRAALHVELAHAADAWLCPWCLDALLRAVEQDQQGAPIKLVKLGGPADCAICRRAADNALHLELLHGDNAWLCRSCRDAILAEIDYERASFTLPPGLSVHAPIEQIVKVAEAQMAAFNLDDWLAELRQASIWRVYYRNSNEIRGLRLLLSDRWRKPQ